MKTDPRKIFIFAMGFLCAFGTSSLLADGTETIGAPSIIIQPGTAVIAAGTGLGGFSGGVTQPQTISVNVPASASVKQVLLYWVGENVSGAPGDNSITVNGTSITGTLIGGPTTFFSDVSFATFRADVSGLNLVAPGANNLSVGGLANNYANDGAGILVILDDGSAPANIALRDGQDLAFWDFQPPLNATVPQTFNFPAAPFARTATLAMLFASAEGAANQIKITIDGVTTTQSGLLSNNSGPDWDTLNLSVTIPAGATTLTVEAVSPPPDGVSVCWITSALTLKPCTGKIGDFVWQDTNKNGCQDAGEPGIPGVQVDLYSGCAPGGTTLIRSTTTDANGLYLFDNLCAGTYTVSFHTPAGFSRTVANAGCSVGGQPADSKDSDCDCTSSVPCGVCVVLPNDNSQDLTIDCGYISDCPITVTKECVVPPLPPAPFDCSAMKPINSLSMIWNGGQTVGIKAWKGAVGSSTLLATIDNIAPGQKVTVTGYAGSPNDVNWEIFSTTTGGAKIGTSTFHVSCSDEDMNGPEDCGKAAGDGKAKVGFINTWIFAGMAGNGKTIDCFPTPPAGSSSCTVLEAPFASCETEGKPTSLTFVYNGRGCANPDNNNPQSGKFTCSGSLGGATQVFVRSSDGYTVSPAVVNVGESFTVTGSFKAQSIFVLSNNVAGGTKETISIHTSCSQPLGVGDVFGDMTLVGFNGKTGGSAITYRYIVKNDGPAVSGVFLTDDKIGAIAGPFSLAVGETKVFEVPVAIPGTTTNTATVTIQGQACTASSGPVVVTVIPNTGPFDCSDAKPIDTMKVKWNGSASPIWVKAWNGNIGSGTPSVFGPVAIGDTVTFTRSGTFPNDVYFEIFTSSSMTAASKLGNSTFHLSCSDEDMNGSEDCGKAAGDGKAKAGFINAWIFTGLAGNGQVLGCP